MEDLLYYLYVLLSLVSLEFVNLIILNVLLKEFDFSED